MSLLTPNQQTFAREFARGTGLDPGVVGSWLLAEQSGSAAHYYEGKGYNNWLNIANTDSGPASGAHSSVWRNPVSAARESANWMRGQGRIAHEYGAPATGIRNILHTAGQGKDAEINAIANSGWASSGYNGGSTLRQLYNELGGERAKLMAGASRMVVPKISAAAEAVRRGAPSAEPGMKPQEPNILGLIALINQGMMTSPEPGQFTRQSITPVAARGEEEKEPLPNEPETEANYDESIEGQLQKNFDLMSQHFEEDQSLKQGQEARAAVEHPTEATPLEHPGAVHVGQTQLRGFLPHGAKLVLNRIDQGQDIQTNTGGAILAPGDGVVVHTLNNPGGFGFNYPVVRFTSGPWRGREVYIGHTHSVLKEGDHFRAGQILSRTGTGTPREGNARTPGWAEIGLWGPSGPTGNGAEMARMMGLGNR